MRPARAWRAVLTALAACAAAGCGGTPSTEAPDTAETVIGERLFRETRFSRFHFDVNAGRSVNAPLLVGDPALETTETLDGPLPGPYAGLAMNCAACHLVDEQAGVEGAGPRTYGDFARRSPIPDRGDGRTTTPRNSPPLVNSALPRDVAAFFHFDGEFASLEDLVAATLTGRNFGWLPGERAQAVAHLARVVREDDGSDANAEDHDGHAYGLTLRAPGNVLPAELLLKPEFRVDVSVATDAEVFDAVVRIIAQYVRELLFVQDPATGRFVASPFDRFLAKNALPQEASPGEDGRDFARRLRAAVDALAAPKFVDAADGRFAIHAQAFRFGELELRGLRIFLAEPAAPVASPAEVATGGVGNCFQCHTPPAFTDFRFHNVGVAQAEYDSIHGDDAFLALAVPTLAVRDAAFDAFLPATESHPNATGPFLDVPRLDDPSRTDLGLWNVFRNPDVPTPQPALRALLLAQLALPPATTDDDLLPRTIAWFKAPGLRDLGQGAPYFHTGAADALEDVLAHYERFSTRARAGLVRNPAPELLGVALVDEDRAALAAFLRALNEDYE